jgi:(R,R)-butanediol dehydrogenase / meso-butanediol dehydrogenase / diacetyl reductase
MPGGRRLLGGGTLMRAAVFHGQGDVRIESLPEPEPGPGEVAIRVAHNGLCGSDLHEYAAGPLFVPTAPHPLTGAVLPIVLGHEFAGTVAAVGAGVTSVRDGDRVCVEPIYRCEDCPACATGAYNLCRSVAFHGLQAHGGGLCEATVVPERTVHPLPESVSLELGALVEPMAVAMHAVRRHHLEGGTAVVFGAGPIGIGVWHALRAHGVDDVLVAEPAVARRAAIAALGARVLDVDSRDPVEQVMEATGGVGAEVVFDAAGVPAAILAGLRCVRPRGAVVSVAVYGSTVAVDPNQLLSTEATWTGSLAYTGEDFRAVIDLMARGHYVIEGWVQHVDLDRLVDDGLEAMAAGRVTKVLVDVGAPP